MVFVTSDNTGVKAFVMSFISLKLILKIFVSLSIDWVRTESRSHISFRFE